MVPDLFSITLSGASLYVSVWIKVPRLRLLVSTILPGTKFTKSFSCDLSLSPSSLKSSAMSSNMISSFFSEIALFRVEIFLLSRSSSLFSILAFSDAIKSLTSTTPFLSKFVELHPDSDNTKMQIIGTIFLIVFPFISQPFSSTLLPLIYFTALVCKSPICRPRRICNLKDLDKGNRGVAFSMQFSTPDLASRAIFNYNISQQVER